MLRSIILVFILHGISWSAAAQIIDSAYLDVSIHPEELNVKIMRLNGSRVITRIDQYSNNDTAVVDLYFTYCAGPASITFFDTIIPISSSNLPTQYNVLLRSFYDTNTVSQFCNINTVPIPEDSVFLSKSDIFLSIEENLKYSQNAIKTYPNPVNQILHVATSDDTEIKSMTIINSAGKPFMHHFDAEETKQIDVSNLPKGDYLFR
ncbi:T9SS type A sorting domain-containing protein [Owenweeksia hongkongensis]|uniref:T9SS type A sorting domain-containing protein n=1 Tax=Owenweeksia hongkongensis TaxID=253245 RepID=UPI003A944157